MATATALLFLGGGLLLASYFTVGKWIEKNVIEPDPTKATTAVRRHKENPIDFNPVNKWILYAYSFPSIAAIGPISGPTLIALFGWLPAALFIIIGNIFMGAVQDTFGLMLGERYEARTIMGIGGDVIGKQILRPYYFLGLYGVISVGFYKLLGALMTAYPQTGTVTILWLFISVAYGVMVSRMRVKLEYATPICIALAAVCLWVSWQYPTDMVAYFEGMGMTAADATAHSKIFWICLINVYAFIGAFLPYDLLIEPRQHLTVYFIWGLMIMGVVSTLISPVAIGEGWPIAQWGAAADTAGVAGASKLWGYGWLWPMLFTLCLCGALSVHTNIHTTTTVCMLSSEEHILLAGYGAMNSEGFQGLLSIVSVVHMPYATYIEKMVTAGPLGAFTYGFGDWFVAYGLPHDLGIALGGLWCVVFVADMDAGRRGYAWILSEAMGWDMGKWTHRTYAIGFHTVLQTFFTIVLDLGFLLGLFGGLNRGYAALFACVYMIWLMKQGKAWWYMLVQALFLIPTSMVAMAYLMWRRVTGITSGVDPMTGGTVKTDLYSVSTSVAAVVSALVVDGIFVFIVYHWYKAYKREKAAAAVVTPTPA
ncbi:MAG: carbon starvation CstA family protein [Candidatus Bathyarchaeia archaeon]